MSTEYPAKQKVKVIKKSNDGKVFRHIKKALDSLDDAVEELEEDSDNEDMVTELEAIYKQLVMFSKTFDDGRSLRGPKDPLSYKTKDPHGGFKTSDEGL